MNNRNHLSNMTFGSLFVILTLFFSINAIASSSKPSFQDSLKIVESKFHYSSKKDEYNFVTCLGTVENNSDKSWDEIVFQVQYFNSQNELIDTATDYNYSMVVPANDKITFRIRAGADRGQEEYKTHKIRITSAKLASCNSVKRKKKSAFMEILISWTPMLILIAVWIFFMRKYQGKNSPQKKIIEIQERQCKLVQEQNILFEKLVGAVNKRL